jgi:hypothetical protein
MNDYSAKKECLSLLLIENDKSDAELCLSELV